MTIHTHAPDRRTLVRGLQEHLGFNAVYAGPPTFTYQLGGLTIERDGSITAANVDDLKAIAPFLLELGWADDEAFSGIDIAVTETEPDTEEDPVPSEAADIPQESAESIDRIDLSLPAPDMTSAQLKNLFFTVYSKQYLLNRMMGDNLIVIPESLITQLQETLPETPADFTRLLDDSRAVAGLTGFDYRDGVVTMALSHSTREPARFEAFAGLLGRMIASARTATRVFPELQIPESEKYAVRNWLLRMGYNGPDLKAHRKELLKNLTGASAFQNAAKAQAHKDKYAEIRRQERELRNSRPTSSNVHNTPEELVMEVAK